MKSLAFLALLPAMFSIAHAADNDADLGNPEVEAIVSVCAKEERHKEKQYKQLLIEPLNCGTVLRKRSLVARSSSEYKSRFEQMKNQVYSETMNNREGIGEACGLLAYSCIDKNTKLTAEEKQKMLQMMVGESQ